VNDEREITEQTAVAEEPNADPNEDAAAVDSGAAQEDGLDELLKEFDAKKEASSQKEPEKAAEPTATEVPIEVLATLEKRLNDYEARQVRKELEGLFDRFTVGVQADQLDAEAFLNAKALRDPRINQAYIQRESNPKRWDKVEAELHKEFSRRFGKKVDKQATESRDAVAAAVRSASTAAPQRDITHRDIEVMSKADFDDLQRKSGVTPV
jgi:hypothetical protein